MFDGFTLIWKARHLDFAYEPLKRFRVVTCALYKQKFDGNYISRFLWISRKFDGNLISREFPRVKCDANERDAATTKKIDSEI